LVQAAFAVVSTHQSALGSVVGYGPFFLFVIRKACAQYAIKAINRLMMMMTYSQEHDNIPVFL
jgi:hypothetical protein